MIPTFLLNFVAGLLGPNFAKFAKPLIYAVAIMLLVGGLGIAKCHYDHKLISTHDANQRASNAEADRKADNNAADRRTADNSRETSESQEAQNAIDHAKQVGADPRAAYYRCVRAQQSARRAGKPSPSC